MRHLEDPPPLEESIQPAEADVKLLPHPHQLGRFRIHANQLTRWKSLVPLMNEMVVMATVYSMETGEMEYTAFCNRFETVAPGELPPLYDLKSEIVNGKLQFFMRKSPNQDQ